MSGTATAGDDMEKKSATAINTEAWERDISDKTMQKRLEYFHERWMPEGRDASEFAADLHMLVRSIYAEAATPANKQLMELMKHMPFLGHGIKL